MNLTTMLTIFPELFCQLNLSVQEVPLLTDKKHFIDLNDTYSVKIYPEKPQQIWKGFYY